MGTILWKPSVEAGWATCHFAIAWAVVFTAAAFGANLLVALGIVLLWAIPKEFLFDLAIEGDSFADSLTDFCWYMIGGAAAAAVLLVKGRYS